MPTMQVQVERAATSEKRHPSRVKQWQNGTVAAMNNQTQSRMSLDRYKNWAGVPSTGSFPSTIAPNDTANFTHLRGGQFGSVAGVQYSGLNATNVKCAWLFAWQAPVQDSPPCPPNRVYVACGPKIVIDAMTWDQVMANLDASATSASANDSSTKTSADAAIHDLTPDTATLVANFRLIR